VEQGVNIVFPVHPNPSVRYTVHAKLGDRKNIFLTEPLDYLQFLYLMERAHLILTDSGGVQEEAPSFGVPVLVLRRATERPEAIEAGTAKLVGTDEIEVYEAATRLLTDEKAYQAMAGRENPFGDGTASQQIVTLLERSHAGF
jgi:UDP-N-acetylglucosamine 2-epimerase (non-hydrolysing)